MAQGPLKKAKPGSGSGGSKRPGSGPSGASQKGKGALKPKKGVLLKQHKINKKLSGGLTAKTEQSLAAKAGHLEMLAGGKKDGKKAGGGGHAGTGKGKRG